MKPKKSGWKAIAVDASSMTADDFEMFGGIEELTDYTVIKAGKKRKHRNQDERPKKKKKVVSEDIKSITPSSKKPLNVEEINETNNSANSEIDMSAWCNCYVPQEILEALKDLGFTAPTEIQQLALPAAIQNHQDILAAAETGSGKTLAFGIPVLTHIMASKIREKERNVNENTLKALILAPTRELALQVKSHMQAVSKYIDIKIMSVVGGMSQEKQTRLFKKSPEIIVATPGRLWQLMQEGEPYLEQVPLIHYLVIDEADRMVEKGHFEELTKLLEIIKKNGVKRRQTFVFSATLTMTHDPPKRLDLKKKAHKLTLQYKLETLMKTIGVKEKPKIIDVTQKSVLVGTLTESQINCSMEEKDLYLYYFIRTYPGRTLVFCNSINCVRRLKNVLSLLGCNPLALHASMHQRQRFKNLEHFATHEHSLLLATDVAARGLDIKGIEHVVHFQVPRTAEIYVHRSGRTARACNEGLSLMLVESNEATYYKRVCKTLNKEHILPAFAVDREALKSLKPVVQLARQIDQQEHRLDRKAAQDRWFMKAAKEMDTEIDGGILSEVGNNQEGAIKKKQIKLMKKQLDHALKRPVVTKSCIGRYPTKSGKVQMPVNCGTEKALNAVKNESSQTLKPKRKKFKARRRKKHG